MTIKEVENLSLKRIKLLCSLRISLEDIKAPRRRALSDGTEKREILFDNYAIKRYNTLKIWQRQ